MQNGLYSDLKEPYHEELILVDVCMIKLIFVQQVHSLTDIPKHVSTDVTGNLNMTAQKYRGRKCNSHMLEEVGLEICLQTWHTFQ